MQLGYWSYDYAFNCEAWTMLFHGRARAQLVLWVYWYFFLHSRLSWLSPILFSGVGSRLGCVLAAAFAYRVCWHISRLSRVRLAVCRRRL